MTKVFDDKARLSLENQLFDNEPRYNGGAVSSMRVIPISAKAARPLIAKNHYTRTFPDSTLYSFVGYIGDEIAGVITFGMGVGRNQYSALVPTIQDGEYCELTRLWSPDGFPKNTESKLIAESIKMLPARIKMVVSFADPSRQHLGKIYQATNFFYCGISAGGKMLVTKDGIEKHPRLLGVYRMRHPEYREKNVKDLMKILGLTYIQSSPKHRYVLLRGSRNDKKTMLKQIQSKILAYPK